MGGLLARPPNFDCQSAAGCPASVIGGRLTGLYVEENILKGDIPVSCTNFTAVGDCGIAIAEMAAINHRTADGYGIQLIVRPATLWERFQYVFSGRGVVPVYFWAGDQSRRGSERYGAITLYVNRVPTTAAHELGHALGLGHNTIDARSVMYPYATPQRLPYPSDADIRTLIDFYRRRRGVP